MGDTLAICAAAAVAGERAAQVQDLIALFPLYAFANQATK